MKTKAWQAKLKQISFRWPKLALVLFSLLALLFFANQSQSVENKSKAVVASCFDGDTVKLADRRVVRITGIDAPEVVHDNAPEPFYAQKARDELFALLGGKKVTLKTTSVTPRDRFGRLLADLILEDGQSIAELMVKRGAAYFFPHKELAPDFQERLLLLQREAITARVGLWELLLEDSVARESYVGNRDSLRFVPANCPQAQLIKPRNRVYFGTLMDAFMAGFAPARICPFWPKAR